MGESPWKFESSRPHQFPYLSWSSPPRGARGARLALGVADGKGAKPRRRAPGRRPARPGPEMRRRLHQVYTMSSGRPARHSMRFSWPAARSSRRMCRCISGHRTRRGCDGAPRRADARRGRGGTGVSSLSISHRRRRVGKCFLRPRAGSSASGGFGKARIGYHEVVAGHHAARASARVNENRGIHLGKYNRPPAPPIVRLADRRSAFRAIPFPDGWTGISPMESAQRREGVSGRGGCVPRPGSA